jgi:preprotein translocase subunit SecG
MDTFLAVLFIIICILLILVVLLQKGRGGGIGAAFGGTSSSAFGTRTGDVFTWVTIVLTGLFLLLAIGATVAYRPRAEPVPMPVFSPDSRTIDKEINVTIRCATTGARIYYLIGSTVTEPPDPTEKSMLYKNIPVRIKPDQVLKARAFRRGWVDSPVKVGVYPKPAPPPASVPSSATAPAPASTSAPATRPSPATATSPATRPASTSAGGAAPSRPAGTTTSTGP